MVIGGVSERKGTDIMIDFRHGITRINQEENRVNPCNPCLKESEMHALIHLQPNRLGAIAYIELTLKQWRPAPKGRSLCLRLP